MSVRILLGAVLAAAVFASAAGRDAAVTVHNRSAWDIYELYLSATTDQLWGEDQLGSHIIEAGGRFSLHGIPCDDYDVRIVDEDGDVCIIGGVSLCGGRETWVIDDADLLTCQILSED